MSQISFDAYNPGSIFSLRSGVGLRVHPVTGALLGHQGLDWSRQPGAVSIAGQPIPVAADGVVVDRGFQLNPSNGTGWGNYIVVEHTRADGSKFQTLYAHLQAPSALSTGAVVLAGEAIGLVGATGGASGPHIHMEVVVGGNARPVTMGGVAGVRLNPAAFSEWGGLPHMVGTDAAGNRIIAQEARNPLDGTVVTTLTYRSPAGTHVQTVRLASQPIDDGGGNTVGYEYSYSDTNGNPQKIVTDLSGAVVSRTTYTNTSEVVDRSGLRVSIDPITGAKSLQIEGVSGSIAQNADGSFSISTNSGAMTIKLTDDPFGGGSVLAGGKEYQFSGAESLSFQDNSIIVDGRTGPTTATQKVITAGGFGVELDLILKPADSQWILADAGGLGTVSDAGLDYGAGNGWLFERAGLLPDKAGSTGTATDDSGVGQFDFSGDEYSFVLYVKDMDGVPTGAVVSFDRKWDASSGSFVVTQVETDSDGNVVAQYEGKQFAADKDVAWVASRVSIRDEAGNVEGYWDTRNDGGVSTLSRVGPNGETIETARSTVLSDGVRVTEVIDSSGAVTSQISTQVFDDGSSITTSRVGAGTVRTTTRDSDGVAYRVVDETSVGTSSTVTTYDGQGELIETRHVQNYDDGSYEVTSRPDGSEVRRTTNSSGQVTEVRIPSYAQTFTSAISDTTSFINAIRSGEPLPQLASGLKLLNTLDRQQAIPNLGTASTIAQGALSLYNLANAFENGDALDQLSATGNAIVAVDSALQAVVGTTALTPIASSVAQALPGLSLIVAIKNDDPVGAAMAVGTMIQGSAFLVSNPIGWVLLAYSLYKAFEEPPEAWGIGTFEFAAQSTELALDTQGESFGIDRVSSLMGAMKDYLDNVIESSQQSDPNHLLGIIPQRLGTLTWREARQDDPGYALRDPDPVTGQESLDFLRYNDDLTPYNADPTVEAQRRSLLERMVVSAIDREAIAPMWEVNTARLQQDIGDPNAGMTEEVRAARRGLLAPVDPLTNKPTAGVFRPIALDLNGDGRITTVADADNNRALNWDGTGFDKQVGWVGSGEGLLWLDRNPNGIVDSGKELFSNSAVADAAKGVRSMSWVDANADGMIDAADPVFAQLKVWQDADGDAVADFNELQSLQSLGITSLDYSNGRFTRNGQDFALQSQDIEANSEGTRVSVVPEGIRVEFSNGQTTVFVTNVLDLGAGNDGIDIFEDGGQEYDNQGVPIGQAATQNNPVSIAPALLLANDSIGGSNAGLVVTAVGNASVGTVSFNTQTQAIEYLAPKDFSGEATFEYTVAAPDGQIKTATVTVNVLPVNDRPDVSVSLGNRAIYGWGPKVVRETISLGGDNGSEERITVYPNEGEPFYAPFSTVQGTPYAWVSTGFDQQEYQPVGAAVDTGIPQSYFQQQLANATYVDEFGNTQAASSVDVVWNGQNYRITASPVLYPRSAVVATEQNNDGTVTVTDADGNGGAGYRYEVVDQPLYGRLGGDGAADDISATTGTFTYTGERYVENDLAGNYVGNNTFTDTHLRGDPVFYDSFKVKVTDLSDNSFTIKTIEVPHYGPRPNPDVQGGGKKPIAIDLNGDGFHFTDVDDSNVFFNVNADGWRRRIAWNNPADGFIAYDKNGDGKISEFDEISFVPYDAKGQTDLEALRLAFDSNNDGVFSAADAKWNAFGVWQDADSDGVTDAGEFRSLNDLGISQIALTSNGQFQVIDGQTVHGTADATKTDGSTLAIADVTLRYKNVTRLTNPDGSTSIVPAPIVQQGQTFDGTAGADLVLGTNGSDMFRTGDGNDVVNDDLGNDGVQAGAGDDLIYTGVDNDVVDAGTGNDSAFTGEGNDLVFGDDGDDFLMLEGGNDVAFGGAGQDFIGGGLGNDAISGDAGDDKLFGEGGWDALFGKDGDDELWGMDGNDLLYGDAGNDLVVGGAGDDTMEGGAGNDTYEVDSAADAVTELADGGSDTVRASIAYTLAETLENLTLTGTATINGTGNGGNNVLVGNEATNRLSGLGGNDVIDGGLGADTMLGGSGDDTYVIDNAGDVVTEGADEGVDTVRSRISYTLGGYVENLELIGIAAIDATGNSLNNRITGNAAANTIDGGAGADTMTGGRGNDRYLVDSALDQVVEAAGEGYDTVVANIAGATYALGDNVEALELGELAVGGVGNALDNLIKGNASSNQLDGGVGADILVGGAGDDTYLADSSSDVVVEGADGGYDTVRASATTTLSSHVEALVLTGTGAIDGIGNAANNSLTGNAGNNVLDGGAGNDAMAGGAGDDTYVVDAAGDSVVEIDGEGTDTVRSSIDYTLGAAVENLVMTGTADLNGSGNALNNNVTGNAGANRIDGGAGADQMAGGTGDDLYIVDNGGDRVQESVTAGIDTVQASVSFALSNDVENLVLTGAAMNGTGNALDNQITGNALGNRLDGGAGADLMTGGAGDDTYVVDHAGDRTVEAEGGGLDTVESSVTWTLADNVENLTLTGAAAIDGTGNALANTLTGNADANVLDGGAGADAMAGGQGDDSYVVDNAGDLVQEQASRGFDRVSSSIDYVLPQHLEQLTLTGAAIRGTGNDLDNLLFGSDQANILDGSTGADQMAGATGDDRYAVDNAGDVITEGLDAGIDTVVSSVSYGLAANAENLILTGSANLAATGNDLANVLVGNAGANAIQAGAGNDVLAGGLGDDSLDGGSGNDLYLYHQGEGRDVIVDASGIDTLRFGAGMTADSVAARMIQVNGQQRLFVSILGTDGQETDRGVEIVLNADGTSPIERVEFANGQSAAFSQIAIASRTLNGTANADTITGDRNDDTVYAGGGADTVYGRTGNDILYGGINNDKLFGEGGNDRLYGETESDELWGGAGDDLLDGGSGADKLFGGTGNDQLFAGVDNDVLDAGDGNDLLDGSDGQDQLFGGIGNDTLRGGTDLDLLAAGDGDDLIDSGSGTAVVVAGRGNDSITTNTSADFVDAGEGNDLITTAASNDFIAGGKGNDRIDAGQDRDIIAFNRGDGADTLVTSSWQTDALSLGGGIRYADIALRKSGNNLVLELGQGDSITLEGWYLDSSRKNIKNLQVVTAAPGGDYLAGSSDRMRNRKAVAFDFEQLVTRFDTARAANPALTSWSAAADLNATYLSGGDTQAIGGNMAYRYATAGSYGDMDWQAINTQLAKLSATTWQALTTSTAVNPWTALQAGTSLIADATQGLPSPITPMAAPTGDELIFASLNASGRKPVWMGGTPAPVIP